MIGPYRRQRRIRLALLGGGAALVIILFATVGLPGRTAGRAPRPGSPAAAPERATATPARPTPATRPAPSAPVAVAVSFTRSFLGAGQAGGRVWGSLATPALAASLMASPGAPAGDAQVRALGTRRVEAVAATVDDQAPAAVGVSTTTTVQFGSGQHVAVLTEYLDLLVVTTPAGWKVSRVDL